MKAQDVKNYIIEDVDRIRTLMEAIGIHRIWETGDELRGAPPESDNHTAISVNRDTLYCRYYKSGETFRGDILSLVQLLRKETFQESIHYVKNLFGLKSSKFVKDDKIDPLLKFRSIIKQNRPVLSIDEIEVPKFGMETLDDFIDIPHINLFHEGIMPKTSELFNICYDPKLDRILFPHHNYDDKNVIVGITGRTTRSAQEIKDLMIPKYWNYISGYKKMYNLYGFVFSMEFVHEYGMLIIFEAEKSVLKNFSQTRNRGYSCAVGGHEISPVQAGIILRHLPVDVEVVIAFDRDVQDMKDEETGESIGVEFLERTAGLFSKYRKTSYIYDSEDVLDKNDSPIDKGYKVFHDLLESRVFVN